MKPSLPEALKLVFDLEGKFSDDKNDPGGKTKWGIIEREWKKWIKTRNIPYKPIEDVTQEDARAIYKAQYWDILKCEQMESTTAIVMFQMGVNIGVYGAARLLQRIVGAEVDGKIGPKTLSLVGRYRMTYGVMELPVNLMYSQMNYYRKLDGWKFFGEGWTNRVRKTANFLDLKIELD